MNKSKAPLSGNDVLEVVNHLRVHEQYRPELIKYKIEPWVVELEKFAQTDAVETDERSTGIVKNIVIIREAVMLGLKEIDAQSMVARYIAAKQKSPEFKKDFPGYALKRRSDEDYSPAERNILWAALNEYLSGKISIGMARRLRFCKPSGEPRSIYPSDHEGSVVSTLTNVYGLDVEGYLADLSHGSENQADREIANTLLDLGIKHKSESQIMEEFVEGFAKTLLPKN
jgi:hypothetical protein